MHIRSAQAQAKAEKADISSKSSAHHTKEGDKRRPLSSPKNRAKMGGDFECQMGEKGK